MSLPPATAICAHATALPETGADGTPPDWICVLPAGTFKGVDGRGPYSSPNPAATIAASLQGGRPMPIDYNHQTVFACLNGGQAPAAGWIDRLEVRGGAIWAHVEWTRDGAHAVASKSYRFVSPTFQHDKAGVVGRIDSVGLVNNPNLTELPAIAAQIGVRMEEFMAQLRQALGLSADADNSAILQACQGCKSAMAATAAALDGLAPALGIALPATPSAIAAAIKTKLEAGAPDPAKFVPMAAFSELQAQVASLSGNAAKDKAGQAVQAAMTAGKISPALKDWALGYAAKDPAGFEAWTTAAPAIVKPGGAGVPPGAPPGVDGGTASEDVAREVCARIGVKLEDYRKIEKAAA